MPLNNFHYQNCTCPEHYQTCEICDKAYPVACECPSDTVSDKQALDEIAKGLSQESEWNADTLQWIADVVNRTGRQTYND